MARQGFRVTAVDISAPALQAAAAASAADGLPADNPTWLLQDIFQLQEQHGVGPDSQDSSCNAAASHTSGYDFIYDCQGACCILVGCCVAVAGYVPATRTA
jgi:hypothetical protein